MLGKLLKYDLKDIAKTIIPLMLITLGLSILTRILLLLGNNFEVFNVLAYFTSLFSLVCAVAVPFTTFIVCIKRYYKNLFKAEGYLTHVLPVKRSDLINSKFISTIIFFILAVIIFILSVIIIYYDQKLIASLNTIVEQLKTMLLPVILAVLIVYFSYYILIVTAYAIGQKNNEGKIKKSVIAGICLYFFNQLIALAGIGIIYILNKDFYFSLINNDIAVIKQVLWFAIILNLIIIAIYYFITQKSLNNKMDIE